jgi:hypothetical protein
MKKFKTLALAFGAVLAVGGALPGLVFVVERVVAAPASAGVAVLLAVTASALVAYLATGVRNAVAWHSERPASPRPALAGAVSLGAAGIVTMVAATFVAVGAF